MESVNDRKRIALEKMERLMKEESDANNACQLAYAAWQDAQRIMWAAAVDSCTAKREYQALVLKEL